MTDRELLELAAKAAGFCNYTMRGEKILVETGAARGASGFYWNPLTDDGDALRLAVKLRLHAKHFMPLERVDFDSPLHGMVEVWQEDGEDPLHVEYFDQGDDRLIVTRRAITRAAAEIGRNMK